MENKKSKLPGTILILAIGAIAIAALLWFWFTNFGGTAKQANTQDDYQTTTAATTTVATTKVTAPATTTTPTTTTTPATTATPVTITTPVTTTTAPASQTSVLNNSLLQSEDYYDKSKITAITFLDSLDSAPSDAWDFSLEEDESVLAWLDGTHLYIAGGGGVLAGDSTFQMFYEYTSLESVGLTCFSTAGVTGMAQMLRNCRSLESITFGDNFDTSSVIYMGYMFDGCQSLESLDISFFDTSKVKTMTMMFMNCRSLEELIVSEDFFANGPVTDSMFVGCRISAPTSYK